MRRTTVEPWTGRCPSTPTVCTTSSAVDSAAIATKAAAPLRWWDAVDVISSSSDYPTGTWEAQFDRTHENTRTSARP